MYVLCFYKNDTQNQSASVFFVLCFGSHVFMLFFSEKLGEIWAKFLRTPKICLSLHLRLWGTCIRQQGS